MISIESVSLEFRSVVERRRRHLTFLFSTGAAFSILADGVLHGRLSQPLLPATSSVVTAGIVAFTLLSFVTAIREARLHKGLAMNGRLWEALERAVAPQRPSVFRTLTVNPFGVSTTLFAIAVLGGDGLLLLLGSIGGISPVVCYLAAGAIATVLIAYFRSQHRAGVAFADDRMKRSPDMVADQQAWRNHIGASIDDAHRDMLELLAMAGLVAFCGFQLLAGLGDIRVTALGALPMSRVQVAGPGLMAVYMLAITTLTMAAYIRLRIAIGHFALQLDESDRPFNPASLDDAFWGYLILVALLAFDVFLLLAAELPNWDIAARIVVSCTIALVAVLAERGTLQRVGRVAHGEHQATA